MTYSSPFRAVLDPGHKDGSQWAHLHLLMLVRAVTSSIPKCNRVRNGTQLTRKDLTLIIRRMSDAAHYVRRWVLNTPASSNREYCNNNRAHLPLATSYSIEEIQMSYLLYLAGNSRWKAVLPPNGSDRNHKTDNHQYSLLTCMGQSRPSSLPYTKKTSVMSRGSVRIRIRHLFCQVITL